METETTQAVFVPPIDRMDYDTLIGLGIAVSVGLGFFLYLLPVVASGVLMGYGLFACVMLPAEAARRIRIAREVRAFRKELND